MSTLVLVETDADGVAETSGEALTFARGLGDPVRALVIGELSEAVTSQLSDYGVEAVHHANGPAFETYAAAAWAAAVVAAARETDAGVVLASGTPRGMEAMAHSAVRLGASMAANTVEAVSRHPMVVNRQVLGGSVLEQMQVDGDIAVLTVAGHACEAVPADAPTTPAISTLEVEVPESDLIARVVRTEPGEPDESGGLKAARVVVGGGRGTGGPDGFGDLTELAELLGGVVGVTRVVTSLGWRPHAEQVGQTGSRISPELYIPCGISGAIQHWAGCSSAKTILAINTEADAPMVTKAHYAVIGDLHEVLPAINEELRRRRG
ncbi:MAG: electron transfer flavoprotein subunit alpha/FixB family protein [Microlunatus sp.]|nr:electron transfer flavoprotein subunit alpha/FixB family protein [Microlunatus sp.]